MSVREMPFALSSALVAYGDREKARPVKVGVLLDMIKKANLSAQEFVELLR